MPSPLCRKRNLPISQLFSPESTLTIMRLSFDHQFVLSKGSSLIALVARSGAALFSSDRHVDLLDSLKDTSVPLPIGCFLRDLSLMYLCLGNLKIENLTY